jgi:hypothetical protein
MAGPKVGIYIEFIYGVLYLLTITYAQFFYKYSPC